MIWELWAPFGPSRALCYGAWPPPGWCVHAAARQNGVGQGHCVWPRVLAAATVAAAAAGGEEEILATFKSLRCCRRLRVTVPWSRCDMDLGFLALRRSRMQGCGQGPCRSPRWCARCCSLNVRMSVSGPVGACSLCQWHLAGSTGVDADGDGSIRRRVSKQTEYGACLLLGIGTCASCVLCLWSNLRRQLLRELQHSSSRGWCVSITNSICSRGLPRNASATWRGAQLSLN